MTERSTRRVFLLRSAGLATGLAALPLLSSTAKPPVASAHNVTGNAARASELYTAMQTNYYLGAAQGYLYNETSPRARSNPYAYLWPFYEATAGTIDLSGLPDTIQQVVKQVDVENRLAGLKAYWNGGQGGYDSYVRPPYGNGGDRFFDDNAWVARIRVVAALA